MADIKKREVAVKRLTTGELAVMCDDKLYSLHEVGVALNAYEVKKSHIKKSKKKAAVAARKEKKSLDLCLADDQDLEEVQ